MREHSLGELKILGSNVPFHWPRLHEPVVPLTMASNDGHSQAQLIVASLWMAGCALGACTDDSGNRLLDVSLDAAWPKLCSQIPAADEAALYTARPAVYSGGSTECYFGVDDAFNTYVSYEDQDPTGDQLNVLITREHDPASHNLEGVGDHAFFRDNRGLKAPDLAAQKGTATCLVLTGFMLEPSYDIPYTVADGSPVFSLCDQTAFAQKLGTLCNHLFAARRAVPDDD